MARSSRAVTHASNAPRPGRVAQGRTGPGSVVARAATLAAVGGLFAGRRFAIQRLRAGWRLMLVTAVGVLVAATLLAAVPIYAGAMTDLGLRFRLARSLAAAGDTFAAITVDRLLLGSPAEVARRDALDAVTAARVGWLGEVLVEERSRRLDLVFVGHQAAAPTAPVAVGTRGAGDPLRQPWGAFLYTLSDFAAHVDVVEGRLPGPASADAEALLPDGFQRHAKIGDLVRLDGPAFDDCVRVPASQDERVAAVEVACRPSTFVSTSATATIVGFVRPRDAANPRWRAFAGGWSVPDEPLLPRGGGTPSVAARAQAGEGAMSLITTREQFFGAFGRRLPELASWHRTGVVVDPATIRVGDVGRAIDSMRAWQQDVSERLGLLGQPSLVAADVLQRFRNEQTFSQVPLLLILLQVVGIVLYYVVVVMATLLDRQAEEIGVLRSRGASTAQIVGVHIIEALVLAVPAAFVAPLLAARIVSLLGRTPGFRAITGGAPLRADVTSEAVLLGIAGALLAFLAILLPAFLAARRGIIDVRREEARPSQGGIAQRYYLDLGFVAFAAFLLWQLNQRGSVFDPGSVGGWSSDPVLLLSPLVVTLAVALMVLRFYPPIMRAVTRLLLVLRGATIAIGLARASRSPAAYARLMLLLVMSVAVGTFATSYGPTVGRSLDERVRYATGTDARVGLAKGDRVSAQRGIEAVRAVNGVAEAALVHRGTLRAPNGAQVTLLSLDPARAATMLWSRDDFAAQPLPELLRLLESDVPPGGGLSIPDDASGLRVDLRSANIGRAFVQARLRDGLGEFWDATIVLPERVGAGWTRGTAALPAQASRPLTFVGFRASDRAGQNLRVEGSLQIDDLVATRPGGDAVLDDFEGAFGWTMYGAPSREETFKLVDAKDAASGARYAEWKWAQSTTAGERLLALADPAVPVSALMNPAALGVFDTRPGGIATATINGLNVPLVVRAQVDLFPTLDAATAFAVVSDAQLQSIAGAVDAKPLRTPNEVWLRFRAGTSLAAQQAALRGLAAAGSPLPTDGAALHRAALLEEGGADPTLQISGSGILTVAFAAVLGLSALGFAVTLALGARARTVEFAVLRAVGTSGRQILRGLLLEWSVVLILGAAIGVVLGRQVAQLMLGFLDVTAQGQRVLPPFIVMTDWRMLALGVGLLTLAVVVTLAAAWAAAMRRATASELRLTR